MKVKNIVLLILGLSIIILLYFNYNRLVLGFIFNQPVNKVTEIKMKGGTVYLKDLRKGLNTIIKVISTSASEDFDPDEKTEYVFRNGLDLFYYVENDTLVLMVRKVIDKPANFPKGINIKQVKLKNPEYMNLHNSYSEKGYEIF